MGLRKPPAGVMKPQNNCKNGRLGRSSPTEAPVQPTSLITTHSTQCCSVCRRRHWPDQFRDVKHKTAFLPKSLNFQALWFLFKPFVKDYRLPLPLWFPSAGSPTKRETSSPSHLKQGRNACAWAHGHTTQASAANALLPLQPAWPGPGPLQLLPLLIGPEKGT